MQERESTDCAFLLYSSTGIESAEDKDRVQAGHGWLVSGEPTVGLAV